MKIALFLSSLWLMAASLFSPAEKAILTGTVTDGKEALIGTSVSVQKNRTIIKGAITDVNGKYRIELEPGTYQVEFAYTGFATQRVAEVKVELGKENTLDVVLEGATMLDEVVVTSARVRSETRSAAMRAAPAGAPRSVTDKKRSKSEGPAEYAGEKGGKPAAGSDASKSLKLGRTIAKTPAPPEGREAKPRDERAHSAEYVGSVKPAPELDAEPEAIAVDGMAKKAEPAKGGGKPSLATPPDAPADDIIIVDGRKKRIVIPFDAETYEEKVILVDVEDGSISEDMPVESFADESPDPGAPAQPAPRAGLLTAGEWNDLHNWNRHWVDILADGETDAFQKMYGFFPRQRYTVMVTNAQNFPIADALVALKGSGKTLWEARTDNTGKAELWAALFSPEKETAALRAELWVNGKKHEVGALLPASEGFNNLKINAECFAPKNVDIVWAVDATGSMGDEIEYLKTELLDVIGRAKTRSPELAFRMGTVFYRDKGDEYITKSSGLSPDIAQTVGFIQKQFAGGGGDYPEAVESALDEAIFGQKWSEQAVARICFLVLDASPHQGAEINASLQKSIREAARLGIRIVPVAASGIQKDTEFLMKFFGLATNGSYVFLTDHSGIGGKHLEPTTDEYKIEPLNNLLVRLISEYTSVKTCEGKSEIRFEGDPQQQPGPVMQALYYPNPATDQFTLELPMEVQSVTIYDSEGKAVRKLEKPVAGPHMILVGDLAAGFYTIRILNNGLMQSGKLMVVRS
ncbi:MAG: carboxypeptidase regulatory-like domain-containing protein [Saprospiraceae bacterium]